MQSELTFSIQHDTDPHSTRPEEVDSLYLLVQSTSKWNIAKKARFLMISGL
jgi:hypothetical protein